MIRFYNTIVKLQVLESMKEDMIELLTKLVFNDKMSNLVTALCRICTKDDERTFIMKLEEFKDITTLSIGLPLIFTLDQNSNILEKFKEQYGELKEDNDE